MRDIVEAAIQGQRSDRHRNYIKHRIRADLTVILPDDAQYTCTCSV